MKRPLIYSLALLFLLNTFSSCLKDENGPVDVNLIEGRWEFEKSTVSAGGVPISHSISHIKNEENCPKDFLEINADGSIKFTDYSTDCLVIEKIGTWKLTGETKLSIDIEASELTGDFEIGLLTDKELLLKYPGSYKGIEGTFNMKFNK